MKTLRVIEFYSGIGGLHLALRGTQRSSLDVVAAYEINTAANDVYRHNFPEIPLQQRNILSITSDELDELNADLFVMSPPCQPFTRQGNRLDTADNRANSFLHLLDEFSRLQKPPAYMLVENVKGFENSETRNELVAYLDTAGYSYREFLLTPMQFGVPNSRMRYYLLARLASICPCWSFGSSQEICLKYPGREAAETIASISEYMEPPGFDTTPYLLTDRILAKYGEILDIVTAIDHCSCCFTKGYAYYVEGTGSVIRCSQETSVDNAYNAYRSATTDEDKAASLRPLKLRYFTPGEIANLMCFPSSFGFLSHTTTKQRYRLLGNSVNVKVVTALIDLLLS